MREPLLLHSHRDSVISTEAQRSGETCIWVQVLGLDWERNAEMQVSPLHDGRTVAPVEMTIL